VVNQREVGTDTHGFAEALKHVLRQDPDVILVGEMRDLETIQIALTAAETGHLVFGTLHTQDAPQSIDRIIDVFPPHQQEQIRVMLAGALKGVVCQTLLKTADGKGRTVACEVMVATSGIKNLIREGKTHQIYSAIQAGAKHGMVAMDQSLATLVKQGKVTYDAALEKCNNVNEFNRLAGRPGLTAHADRGGTMATATLSQVRLPGPRPQSGKMVTGQLEADNQEAVASKLKSMGYAPVKIDEVKETGLQMEIKIPGFGGPKVKLKDLAIFSRQFATMINSGLSLIRALSILPSRPRTRSSPSHRRGPQRGRGGPEPVAAMASTRRSSRSSTSRWSAPVRPPACSTRSCSASPRCRGRTSSCAARSSRR
jgi:hypothetical protein